MRYAPTYVYTLPTDMSMEFTYQRDPTRRGTFYGNRVFVEMLHARGDALVADPESAALFFIPVMLMQMRDSLWEAKRFLPAVIHHISSRYPFWNRSNGADHYIFTGQDMGGCWIPELLRNAHIVSHFGFTASIKLWVNQPKWMEARQERDQRAWLGGENYTSYLFPKCYRRHKDVVVPIDVSVPREDRERQHARLAAECGADGDAPEAPKKVSARSKTLLYMAGSVVPSNKGGSGFYSQDRKSVV